MSDTKVEFNEVMVDLENLLDEAQNELVALRANETKAGARRLRKVTTELAKVGKEFRKLSIENIG